MSEEHTTDISFELPAEVACPSCKETIDVHGIGAFQDVQCPHCEETFVLPVQFAHFVLLEEIGHGGMGTVFRAHDPMLKRKIAMKVMRRELGGDEEFVKQFIHEAQTLAKLNNPNVVQVYSAGSEQGQPFIAMELVDGGQLSELIKPNSGLDEATVVKTAIDVIRGMEAVSEIGLAHGDVKPENILFDRKGQAKVVDFGLARFKGEEFEPGVIWGTPYYIAPEVVRGKQPDMKADIYSLGCTLYYALTGTHPFDKATLEETVAARFREKPRALVEINSSIHQETAAVVERMMEVDTIQRYPNYKSLLDDMTAAQMAVTKAAKPAAKKKPFQAWRIVLTAATLLIFLTMWMVMGRQTKKAAPPPEAKTVAKKAMVEKKATPIPAEKESVEPKPITMSVARQIADDASSYDTWENGVGAGEGFDSWKLQCGSTASGFFVGSSDANAGEGRINTAGKAWGMYASAGESAEAWRRLSDGPLAVGESLFVDLDHGFIGSDGPSVGVGLQDSSEANLWEFYFPGGATEYVIRDAEGERSSGIPYSSESLLIEFRLTSPTEYAATIFSGMSTATIKGSLATEEDQGVRVIHLWNNNAGAGSEYDVYFNNLRLEAGR